MLLSIFDEEGGFEAAAKQRACAPRGCKGLTYGGKPHILDAINVLKQIWGDDAESSIKYATREGVQSCWRKAQILPATWDADINNQVGRASLNQSTKNISDEECANLCAVLTKLTVCAKEAGVNCCKEAYVYK